MRDADLRLIAGIVRRRAGIVLGPDKAYLIESRLASIARRFRLVDVAALADALRAAPSEPLVAAVTEALTTNETSFFRDERPFVQLSTVLLPRLIQARAATRRLRIWSAAASTGQEAYSIAMCLDELRPPLTGWDLSILGTDLARPAIERAREARFSTFEVERGLSPARLARHCRRLPGAWVIGDRLRRIVAFSCLNLLDGCRELGQFDVIFLRNVLIYFDLETRRRVLEEVAAMLPDDGYLLLGGTETVLGVTDAVTAVPEARGVFRPARAVPEAATTTGAERSTPGAMGLAAAPAPGTPGASTHGLGAANRG